MTAVAANALQKRINVCLHDDDDISLFRDRQGLDFSEKRNRVFPRSQHNKGMDTLSPEHRADQRRAAFRRALEGLIAAGTVTSLNDWCKKAKVGFNTPSDFLKGLGMSMTDRTYQKLADAVGLPVAVLLGEQQDLTGDEREFVELYRSLTPAERRKELRSLRAKVQEDEEPPGEDG